MAAAKHTVLGYTSSPEYGWVVAKEDPKAYWGKRDADYYAQTGKHIDPSWQGWNYLDQNKVSLANKNYTDANKVLTSLSGWNKANFGTPKAPNLTSNSPSWQRDITKDPFGWYNNPTTSIGQRASANKILNPITPPRYDYQGNVTQKTLDLANPNNYDNPELTRYYDGPNANMNYRVSKDRVDLWGNNTSKTRGGEDLVNEVAKYYQMKNTDPHFADTYGSLVGKNGNQYTFNKNGINSNYFYTPYDLAISGNSNGDIANQDISYWKDKPFYDNGFLSTSDPGTRKLGTETNEIGYSTPKTGGGSFLGGLLKGLPMSLALGAIPGGWVVGAAKGLDGLLDPDKPEKVNVFKGNFLDGAPKASFGTGVPEYGTNATPNILNPGTGGSNQTTTSLNKFKWNNTDYNISDGSLYNPNGTLAYNKNSTGSTELGNAYNTYLGTL